MNFIVVLSSNNCFCSWFNFISVKLITLGCLVVSVLFLDLWVVWDFYASTPWIVT